MNLVTFKGYGINAPAVTVVAERVLSFHEISYNGCFGTCITLDTGKEVCVEEWPSSVIKALQQVGVA